MKRTARIVLSSVLLALLSWAPVEAAGTRIIVRVTGSLPLIQSICARLGCGVNYGLGDPDGQLFLVTTLTDSSPTLFLSTLNLQLGIVSAELDVTGQIQGASDAPAAPPALSDRTPVDYFGTTAWHGYVAQPASQIVGLAQSQTQFNVHGEGIVAVIDTGVDASHPVLAPSLLSGYDFTRNRDSADEAGDVQQSTVAVVDGVDPAWVSQSTVAVVDQSTAATVDTSKYAAFGHGTMVAGIVHLVAPTAWILPLKAFRADGSGYRSDVIRAIYYAVKANARVLNMSFSFSTASHELSSALTFANRQDVICVGAAGNDGRQVAVYPAAYTDLVMGIASTSNDDTRSAFSNYGQPQVWVGAPGEGIVTTYPWKTYAAAWGTSFSAPFVSGAAALLLDVSASAGESQAADALAHAKPVTSELGNGRLDLYQAVAAWRQQLGIQ
jgi:subtilisin family serine protease